METEEFKILIVASNPKSATRLRLDEEVREISNSLNRAKARIDIKQCWAAQPSDLSKYLLDYRPQIVHFSGHGKGEEGLYFENKFGNECLVSSEALANLFQLFSANIQCVILNACYSEIQAKSIVKHIDFVIGMSKEIKDSSAITFSSAFYNSIGSGETIKFSFDLGCIAIQMEGLADHKVPTLLEKRNFSENHNYNITPPKCSSEKDNRNLVKLKKKKTIITRKLD